MNLYKWEELQSYTKEELIEIIVELWELMRNQQDIHARDWQLFNNK